VIVARVSSVSNLLPNLDDLLTELPGATPGVEDARAIVEAAADETPRPATASGPDVITLLDGVPLTPDEQRRRLVALASEIGAP